MSGLRHWCIICEGKSEITYLALLNRFIRDHLVDTDSGFPPLLFSGKPRDHGVGPGKPPVHGVGTGNYKQVEKAYRDEWKANRRANFRIWVDADLYLREKADAPAAFAQRKLIGKGLFSFSALVFEDFLAMHFDDALYADWKQTFAASGHFQTPLFKDEHEPLFLPFWQRAVGDPATHYDEGDLPDHWITKTSLANLFRHCDDPSLVSPVRTLTHVPTFGEFLRDELTTAFPSLLSVTA